MDARTDSRTQGRTTLKQYTHPKQSLWGYNKQTKINKKTTRKITLITYKVILTTRNNCYHLHSIDNQRPKYESLTLKNSITSHIL